MRCGFGCTSTARPPSRGRDAARAATAALPEKERNKDFARRTKASQFRDIRPKATSEIASLDDASKLLGRTDKQTIQKVYRRVGEVVRPTR